MDKITATKIIEEAVNRYATTKQKPTPIDFSLNLFDIQREIIEDPSRYKALCAGRRFGKTELAAYYLIQTCVNNNDQKAAFIGLTANSAKDIIWDTILDILDRYKIGAKINITKQMFTFPSGSKLMITGADNKKETRKHLGKHYSLTVIDEIEEFGAHLEYLISKVLKPTLIDYAGTILLIGTPGLVSAGLWYEIAQLKRGSWKVWNNLNLSNNPKMPRWSGKENWKELALQELEDIKQSEGFTDESPTYIREYLGRWVETSEVSVYSQYNYANNSYTDLPPANYNYLIGIDYGIVDPSAIVVGAYSDREPVLYIVDIYKQSNQTPEQMANRVAEYYEKYRPIRVVADGNGIGKAFLSQLESMYQFPVELAKKHDKLAFIELLNDEFRQKRIKIHSGCTDLHRELIEYQWLDPKAKILPQAPEDHLCDALLYMYRESIHYTVKQFKPVPEKTSPDYDDYLWEQELERMEIESQQAWWERI